MFVRFCSLHDSAGYEGFVYEVISLPPPPPPPPDRPSLPYLSYVFLLFSVGKEKDILKGQNRTEGHRQKTSVGVTGADTLC